MSKLTDKGLIINGALRGMSQTTRGFMSFTDGDGLRVLIHTGTVIRLYELYMYEMNRQYTPEVVKELTEENYNESIKKETYEM